MGISRSFPLRQEQQVREFHPQVVCVYEEEKAREFRERLKDVAVRIVTGMDGLIETACVPEAEIVVTAVVGMIGIRPTIAAIEAGKDIALANKETLVTAFDYPPCQGKRDTDSSGGQ